MMQAREVKIEQVNADTYDKYVALPKSEREYRVWFWPTPWYKTPYAMLFSAQSILQPGVWRSEWDKISEFFKKNYPIQYRVRDIVEDIVHWYRYDISHCWRRFWNNWVIGQRVEMRKAIFKREYQDLDTMLTNFHMEVLIEYVEREKPFEHFDFDTGEADRTFRKELVENYDYASRIRPKQLEYMENADISVDEFLKLDTELDESDTKVCEWVIKNRHKLWT